MKYIDIHCHLDFPDYGTEFADVVSRMKKNDVGAISIGCDIESSRRAVKIAEENENIWVCIGVHPVDNEEKNRGAFIEAEFDELMKSKKVVGVGECGLDWFRMDTVLDSERKRQTKIFEQQINFALKYDKPLMLHCRNSYSDTLDILERYKKDFGYKLRGDTHFFAGNKEEAKRFLDIGFTLSFTGVITFTHDYDSVIDFVPIDSIMSETDAPFVAPVPHRGKRNEPSFVIEVVKRMAEIKGVSVDEMAEKIKNNAIRLFGLGIA